MLFSIRIFTATLGGKKILTKRQVFSNWAEKGEQKRCLEKYLHHEAKEKMSLNTAINENNCYY